MAKAETNRKEGKRNKEDSFIFRWQNRIGIIVCLAIFISGFVIHGNLGLYFNIAGLLVVFGGTFGAALICFGFKRLFIVMRVLKASMKSHVRSPDDIVEILVDLSVKSKMQGLLSLQDDEEETTVIFLRQALGYLVDGYKPQEIREFLSAEIYFFRQRREENERVLTTLAEISPSFGLVGSVVGLISMLSGIGDTTIILSTIPVALTSTLYGIILSNFCFLPFAASIRERTDHEVLLHKIITEGTVAIASDFHPRVLEKKLKSYLTPAAREGRIVTIQKIKDMFETEKKTNIRKGQAKVAEANNQQVGEAEGEVEEKQDVASVPEVGG